MLSLAKTAKGYPIMHLPTLFIILFAKSLWTLWIYCRYPSLLFLLFLFLKSLLHNYNFYSYYCHRFWWVVVVVIDPSACHACPSQIPPPPYHIAFCNWRRVQKRPGKASQVWKHNVSDIHGCQTSGSHWLQRIFLQILKIILRFTTVLVCPINFEPLKFRDDV